MNDIEIKEAFVNIWTSAMALFDVVEKDGGDAPLDSFEDALKMKKLLDATESIRLYYLRRNILRMLALGVTPEQLMKIHGPDGG